MENKTKLEIERLMDAKAMSKNDVLIMEGLIKTYIDPKAVVCVHCGGQIKYAQTRLKNWYTSLEQTEEAIELEQLPETKPVVKKQSVKGPGCVKCKQKVARSKTGGSK